MSTCTEQQHTLHLVHTYTTNIDYVCKNLEKFFWVHSKQQLGPIILIALDVFE